MKCILFGHVERTITARYGRLEGKQIVVCAECGKTLDTGEPMRHGYTDFELSRDEIKGLYAK